GELGEVVGGVQVFEGGREVAGADEVVPVGDVVAEGAGVVAERDAAVHASGGLLLDQGGLGGGVDLVPVLDSYWDWSAGWELAVRHVRRPWWARWVGRGVPPAVGG